MNKGKTRRCLASEVQHPVKALRHVEVRLTAKQPWAIGVGTIPACLPNSGIGFDKILISLNVRGVNQSGWMVFTAQGVEGQDGKYRAFAERVGRVRR